MSLEDILLEFSTVVHGEVLMAVPRKRYDALAAELADWKRMRNEAMAQATFNRNEIDALAASVDRLTSDKARLAAELAAEQESNTFLNNLHKVDQDRILAFEAALKEICECDRVARHCDACQEIATDALRTTAETACEHEWRSTQESYGEDADGNRGVMVNYEICTKCEARRDEL